MDLCFPFFMFQLPVVVVLKNGKVFFSSLCLVSRESFAVTGLAPSEFAFEVASFYQDKVA